MVPSSQACGADRRRRGLPLPKENIMQLAHGTIVAVADGEKFTLYRNGGSDGAPHLTAIGVPDVGDADPIGSGGRHHSSAANPDDRQLVEDGHAAAVADTLNKMALSGELDALVVVAPSRTLGELRKHWHKALSAKLVAEIGKDLGNTPLPEIAALLAKHEARGHGAVDA